MENIRESILSLREQGKTYAEIVEELKCSKGLVSYHVNPSVKAKVIANSLKARKRRLERLNSLKEAKPCADCGGWFEGYLMDFDHLPEHIKVKKVSTLIQTAGWSKIEEELIKCDLVCCMCHRKRTRDRWLTNPFLSE